LGRLGQAEKQSHLSDRSMKFALFFRNAIIRRASHNEFPFDGKASFLV